MRKLIFILFYFSFFVLSAVSLADTESVEDITSNDFPNFSQEFVLRASSATALFNGGEDAGRPIGGCNGVMISNDLFLTAAHCLTYTEDNVEYSYFEEDGYLKAGKTTSIVFNWQYKDTPFSDESTWGTDVASDYTSYYSPFYDDEFRVWESFAVERVLECGRPAHYGVDCIQAAYENIHGSAGDPYNDPNSVGDALMDQDWAIIKILPNNGVYPGVKYGWAPLKHNSVTSTAEPVVLVSNHGGWAPHSAQECEIYKNSGDQYAHVDSSACWVQHGTSGSPVFDKYGRVAGVVSTSGISVSRADVILDVSPEVQSMYSPYNELHIGKMIEDYTDSSNAGVTTMDTYSVNGNTYLFTLRKSDGVVNIYELTEDYLNETYIIPGPITVKDNIEIMDSLLTSYNWTDNKWDVARAFSVDGNNYLFLMGQTTSGTNVHVNTINSNGTISTSYYNYNWSAGWSIAEFFTAGGNTYLYLYRASDGEIHIQQMNSNGTVGSRVYTLNDWIANYTTANFFYQNGNTYLFTQRYSDANSYVYIMNNDGSRGSQVDFKNLSSLYTSTAVYSVGNNKNYLFLLKGATGVNYITEINSDGTIGSSVSGRDWSSGYTQAHFFSFPKSNSNEYPQNYMLILKESTGLIHLHSMF